MAVYYDNNSHADKIPSWWLVPVEIDQRGLVFDVGFTYSALMCAQTLICNSYIITHGLMGRQQN